MRSPRSGRIFIGELAIPNPDKPFSENRKEFVARLDHIFKGTGFFKMDCVANMGDSIYWHGRTMQIYAMPIERRLHGKRFWEERLGKGWGEDYLEESS